MNYKNKHAFTLVELIVVITILVILGTIAFISLQGYAKSARDSKRIADIQNIRKSLELFILNTSKYPIPDNSFEALYSGNLVRTQGVVGDNITTNLSKNLQSMPLDPLTETPYTYSVTYSQNEYELLSIYETSILSHNPSKLLNNTLAADTIYPKIDGTYNQIFVKTPSVIVPTPSIINSEISGSSITLDENTIKSQVITGGDNYPSVGVTPTSTGELDIDFLAFTGSISADSNDFKVDLFDNITDVYSASEFVNDDIYKPFLSLSTPEEKITIINKIGLGDTNNKLNIPWVFGEDNTIIPTGVSNTYAVTSSDDGTKMYLVVYGGKIYKSIDRGLSWVPKETINRYWVGIKSSGDGKNLIATEFGSQTQWSPYGNLFKSNDYGETWTQLSAFGTKKWRGVDMSNDGMNIIVSDTWAGSSAYTSSDGGNTWTNIGLTGTNGYGGVKISNDGTVICAANPGSNKLMLSNNSGVTFSQKLSSRRFSHCATSEDGNHVYTVSEDGYVNISSDGGSTFIEKVLFGTKPVYTGIETSSDGKNIVITGRPSDIFTSNDYGNTWKQEGIVKQWANPSLINNGTQIVTISDDGTMILSK